MEHCMAITRQVITSLQRDGTDMLGTRGLAVKIVDESIVSGSLLTVESNHFCVLKSRGAVLNIYETGQYALTTPDKPLLGSKWRRWLTRLTIMFTSIPRKRRST
jgi:membrane protease subunit (stomatin/prohibitin family)